MAGITTEDIHASLSIPHRVRAVPTAACLAQGPVKNNFTFLAADPSRLAAFLVGALVVTQLPATAQDGRPLELQDYYRIEGVGNGALSPDGTLLAFVRSRIIEAENRRHSEIWLVPTDGSTAPRRLTNPATSAANPRWSPDGALLAFGSSRRLPDGAAVERSNVWFLPMGPGGGEAFQIPGVTGAPVFSPDNRWIAFTRTTPPDPRRNLDPSSDDERLIEERFTDRIYNWMNYRFNGRGYLRDPRDPDATPPAELYIVSRDGGAPRQLTSLGVNVSSVTWRPDSGALAFSADTHQRNEHNYGRSDLWVVDLDGETTRLTDDRWTNWGGWGNLDTEDVLSGVDHVIVNYPIDETRMGVTGYSYGGFMTNWIIGHTTTTATGTCSRRRRPARLRVNSTTSGFRKSSTTTISRAPSRPASGCRRSKTRSTRTSTRRLSRASTSSARR